MPPRVPPEPQAQLSQELAVPKIVLAIDYGTTFTGTILLTSSPIHEV